MGPADRAARPCPKRMEAAGIRDPASIERRLGAVTRSGRSARPGLTIVVSTSEKMRALTKTLARRLPIVRSLLDRESAASAECDTAPTTLPSGDARDVAALTRRYAPPTEYCKIARPEDIDNVVSSFVTSREFVARGLLTKTYRDKLELVHLPGFSLFASSDDLAVGSHVAGGHSYEPAVATVLSRYAKPGMAIVDI